MSLFNIKLKTKNGNDLKSKESFTVIFRMYYKVNALTKKVSADYTYKIIFSKGIIDSNKVLTLKDSHKLNSYEDFTLKVMLNLCYILTKISEKYNITPDFITFYSPEFDGKKNKSWMFLNDVFKKDNEPVVPDRDSYTFSPDWVEDRTSFDMLWEQHHCDKHKIVKDELMMLREFFLRNPNTVMRAIDPYRDLNKYMKTIEICAELNKRLHPELQSEELDF